jgi:hypothetical protein
MKTMLPAVYIVANGRNGTLYAVLHQIYCSVSGNIKIAFLKVSLSGTVAVC